MTPKEYLSQIKYIDDLITSKLESIADLRASVTNITSRLQDDRVQTSGKVDFTDTINKIVDMEREVNGYVDQLVDLKLNVEREINQLSDNMHVIILTNCYVLNKTLRDVADDFYYSYSHIKTMHGQALVAFKKKFPEKFGR